MSVAYQNLQHGHSKSSLIQLNEQAFYLAHQYHILRTERMKQSLLRRDFTNRQSPSTSLISEVDGQVSLTPRLAIPYEHCQNSVGELFCCVRGSPVGESERFIKNYPIGGSENLVIYPFVAEDHE